MAKIRTVELFSGAGLLSEGFRRAGFQAIFAAEADPRAVASFNRNLSPVAEVWDVRKVREGLQCEVLVAGPPCQGFSSLGRRDPNDERNQLSLKVVEWAIESQAKVVVIENVPQYLSSAAWFDTKRELEKQGYESVTWVLDARDYGAPQTRTRAFAIFSIIGLPDKPKKSNIKYTVRDAFDGLPITPSGKGMDIAPPPSTLALSRFHRIPACGDKRDIMTSAPDLCPPSWSKVGNQATDVWGRMDYDKPSNTIRCSFQNPSKGRYIHPIADRVITLREGARLQGISDDWELCGDRTSIARQIGNGVPIPLAQAVARSVADLFA